MNFFAAFRNCLATMMCFGIPQFAFSQSYRIIDLGKAPGSNSSFGWSINNQGQIAGHSLFTENRAAHAFVYSNGQMQNIGGHGGFESYGMGINANGQVIGYSSFPMTSIFHAFIYQNGDIQDIGTLGGDESYGFGINASGQATGSSTLSPETLTHHAFLYTHGIMQDLGTLGGQDSYGYAINAAAQITGSSSIAGDAAVHAFLYTNGIMQDLGTLGGEESRGNAINDSGWVTGVSTVNGLGDSHAFLYKNGMMLDLGAFGGERSIGMGINSQGDVVGGYYGGIVNAQGSAFLYSQGQMVDLNTLLPSNSGWYLYTARSINDKGAITGIGQINGERHAYLLYRVGEISGRITLQNAVDQAQFLTVEFRPIAQGDIFQRNVTLNPDGTFALTNVPPNSYHLWIKGRKWLANTTSIDTTNGSINDIELTLAAGDANDDNVVDIADLLVLINAYNQVSPDSSYSDMADFNCDGANDIADLLLLIGNYNQMGD